MPVAVIVFKDKDTIPAVIDRDSDDALLDAVNNLNGPTFDTIDHLRAWLETQPAPSGLFADAQTAMAHLSARKNRS